VPCIVWGPGAGIRKGYESSQVIRAMDWYPTLATLAGIRVPWKQAIDGRDITPLLTGKSETVPPARLNTALNGKIPLRRKWNHAAESKDIVTRDEYERAFFYFGSHGALAAVRLEQWKLALHPTMTLYDLQKDPGETKPVRNGTMIRKLRGMVVMFQEEMARDARPAGRVVTALPATGGKKTGNAPAQRTSTPQQVRQRLDAATNVTYVRYGDRTLEMDIYRPKNAAAPLPALVAIHGGGWYKGSPASHTNLAMALADRGFVVANIAYRLSGEAPFPAAIHDCKAAVRFLRANADKYGIDPKRIGAIGLSAGGHLTALLATSGGVKALEGAEGVAADASTIQAAVAMGATTDLQSQRLGEVTADEKRGKAWRLFLGGTLAEKPENYKLASPLYHLDAADPPLAMMTGGNDSPHTQGQTIRAKMKALGLPDQLKVITDAPHPFLGRQVWFDQCVDYAAAFFTVHLKATE